MGNTRYHTKDNGQSYSELEYDIWGNPTSPNMLINNDNGVFIFATFTGHIYDTVLDIYFAEARFYDAKNRQWMNSDPMKDGLNWYQYVRANPATWVDPWGLFTSLEDYKYQLEKKLADPLTSVYLEPGLREAALGYIYDSMNSNGRNGVLDLSIISLKDTPESRVIIGAIRKLSGLHGEPIYGDGYFERMMDAVASAYKYSPPAWHIFDTAMFGYFTQLSCGVQQLVDSNYNYIWVRCHIPWKCY